MPSGPSLPQRSSRNDPSMNKQTCVGWEEKEVELVPLQGPARAAKPQAKTRPQRHEEPCSAKREREKWGRKLSGGEAFNVLAVEMIWQGPENKALGTSVIKGTESVAIAWGGVASEEGNKSVHRGAFQHSMCTFQNK